MADTNTENKEEILEEVLEDLETEAAEQEEDADTKEADQTGSKS